MSAKTVLALKVDDSDNVATVFDDVSEGTMVECQDKKGDKWPVKAINSFAFGHKIAVADIAKGEQITKYGEEIGVATRDIKEGEHVHVHNLDSIRGRGDWK